MNPFKDISWKIWLLVVALIAAVIIIAPNPWAHGVQVSQINAGSPVYDAGLRANQKILSINDVAVNSIGDVQNELAYLQHDPVAMKFTIDGKEESVLVEEELLLRLSPSLEVLQSSYPSVQLGQTISAVNSVKVSNLDEFWNETEKVLPQKKLVIKTDTGLVAYFARGTPDMSVTAVPKSNIKKGLDLEGGTRVLVRPVTDNELTDAEMQELTGVLQQRLDVFGLSDVTVRPANDLGGHQFVLIEIAGMSRRDVQKLLESQGKFEAKIGNETVFIGGKQDIPFVCRNDGSCSGVRNCAANGAGYQCTFQFAIKLSPQAAQRQADITKDLPLITESGRQYVDKKIDFYLDGVLVNSLRIGGDLKGVATQDIAISGSGAGNTKQAAEDAANQDMEVLQNILVTGSLPYDIEIVKIDTISPSLGDEFLTNAIVVGLLAMVAVMAVIYFRYRKLKIVLPMIIIMISEVILTLAFAPLLRWNLDLVSIAGIIAAVGTGVDDQIVIADEVSKGSQSHVPWKQRMKNAFFIILSAYALTVAAMLPLFRVGAGLIRGFAITTIVGVTVGVLITRPAYGAIVEKLMKNDE